MLLRNRPTTIDSAPTAPSKGYEHVPASAVCLLRWLNASGIDYVLVGSVARAVRGDKRAQGPVAIVPAPYGRNLERLSRALSSVGARERSHSEMLGIKSTPISDTLRLSPEQLLRASGWTLCCGDYEIDIEGRPAGGPSFQDLLYEAVRTELAGGVVAEVACPEDIEHYAHIRRTGRSPQMLVTRV